MPKAEISWKRTSPDGVRVQVYARHVGDRWIFFKRERRYERWERIEQPPLEDWLELLDAVQRRIQRRRLRREIARQVQQAILSRFPDVKLD